MGTSFCVWRNCHFGIPLPPPPTKTLHGPAREILGTYPVCLKAIFYPFKLNGISNYLQFDHPISVLRVVGRYFHFYSNFNRTFCKQTNGDPDKTPRSAASYLGLHCLPMSHQKDVTLGFYGLKMHAQLYCGLEAEYSFVTFIYVCEQRRL